MAELFAVIVSKPTFQGTLEHKTLVRNVSRADAEAQIARLRAMTSNPNTGAAMNVGKVEIIPQERWDELRAQRLV